MKKLGVTLLILALVLTACGNHSEEQKNSTDEEMLTGEQSSSSVPDSLTDRLDSYVADSTADSLTNMQGTQDDDNAGQSADGVASGDDVATTDQNGGASVADGTGSFDAKDDTVYASVNVVVRNKPSTSGDPVMNLKQGESVHRVGYSADWTKVELNGYFYYIATRYLSETQ